MLIGDPPTTIDSDFDAALPHVPNALSVFLIWPREGRPYMARTALLRRRLIRLLGPREQTGRMLHLRDIAVRVEYWLTASKLETALLLYQLARQHFGHEYERLLKLRQPTFVKLLLSNTFPRTTVTTRISGSDNLHYGPFRSRAAAEKFEAELNDLFQLRRCPDDLEPSHDHPGCVYGEMNKCLRPCQMVVGVEEYASEAARLNAFLESDGITLIETLKANRDRWSEEMEFEEAARTHKRIEKVQALLAGRDDLVTNAQTLCGVAVTRALELDCVHLWFCINGVWQPRRMMSLKVEEGRPMPMDRRLREVACGVGESKTTLRERQDHLAMLAAWYYSGSRDGEWIAIERFPELPYRKMVNAIHRVARNSNERLASPRQ